MAGNGWEWLEWHEMTGMSGNGWNGWNGWKWMEMTEHGLKCLKMSENG